MMLNTTFAKLHKSGACPEGYRELAKYLGGITKYGQETPIPLSVIVDSNGLQDALWTLQCTIEPSENILIEFACRCAEHVLHIYEDKHPDDKRPRLAIDAARRCITDKSPAAWAAAGDAAWAARAAGDAAWAARAAGDAAGAAGDVTGAAAWAAARAAAWAAARAAGDAAWAAARAAETDWQKQTFLELLNK